MARLAADVRDLAGAFHLVDQTLHDRFGHEDVVRGDEGQHAEALQILERGDQRVHIDDRHAGFGQGLDRLDERANGARLDRHEVPFLGDELVELGPLCLRVEFAVEPRNLDAEQPGHPPRRFFTLCVPGSGEARAGHRSLERLVLGVRTAVLDERQVIGEGESRT